MQQPQSDTKDWTWVITAPCPECGYDAAEIDRVELPELARDYAAVIADAARADHGTARPSQEVWSPLEYACHVRDVCSIFVARVQRTLTEDDPEFANWDQDATALLDEYWTQRPGLVAGQLIAAADTIAARFAQVADVEWSRPARRSNGSTFTVETLAYYFLHDLAHHAWDVTASAAAESSAR